MQDIIDLLNGYAALPKLGDVFYMMRENKVEKGTVVFREIKMIDSTDSTRNRPPVSRAFRLAGKTDRGTYLGDYAVSDIGTRIFPSVDDLIASLTPTKES